MSDGQTERDESGLEEPNATGSKRNRRKQVKPRHVDTTGLITNAIVADRPEEIVSTLESTVSTDSYTCGKCAQQFYQLPAYFQHKKVCSRHWPLLSPEDLDNVESSSPEPNSSGPPSLDTAKLPEQCENNNQPQFNFDFPPQPQLYQQLVQKIYSQMFGPDSATKAGNADKTLEFLREQMLSCIETLKAPVDSGLDLSVKTAQMAANCSQNSSESPMEEDFNCELCDSQFGGGEELELHYQTQHKPNPGKRPKSYPSCEEAEDSNIDNPNSFYNLLFEANINRPKSCPPVVVFDSEKVDQQPTVLQSSQIESTPNGRQDNFTFQPYSPMELFPANFTPYPNGIFNPSTGPFTFGYKPTPAPQRPNGRQSMCRSRSNADIDDDWESMMEISTTDENEKLQKLVDKLDSRKQLVSDPNQCVICQRILSCKSALQMHYRTHTGERPFKCKICLRAFTTKGNLKTHMGVHRTKPPLRLFHQCPVCHKKFGNGILLHQHIRTHSGNHTAAPMDSSSNGRQTPKLVYPGHNDFSFFNSRFISDCINDLNERSAVLSQPVKQELKTSENGKILTKLPSVSLPTPPAVSTAAETSSERRHSVIDWGGKTPVKSEPAEPSVVEPKDLTSISSSLSIPNSNPFTSVMLPTAQQVAMMSGRPNTTCNICFKTFACNSALEIHYRSHTKERPFKCQVCQRGFSTKGNMKQHLLTHKSADKTDKKLSASVDGRGDNGSSSPDRRNPGRSGSVPIFDCRPADFRSLDLSSTQSESPRSHSRTSPEVREAPLVFPSPVERSAQLPNLAETPIVPPNDSISSALSPLESIRKMWDKTEPPAVAKRQPVLSKHQCQVCYKHFSSASALQIHMRTHTGDKPFKCDVCDRAFTTKGNLKVHMGTHVWNTTARRGRRNLDSPPTSKPFEVEFLGAPQPLTQQQQPNGGSLLNGRIAEVKVDRKASVKTEIDYESVSDDGNDGSSDKKSDVQPLPATANLAPVEQRRVDLHHSIFPSSQLHSNPNFLPSPNPFALMEGNPFFGPAFPQFSPFSLSPEQLYQQTTAHLSRPFGPPAIYGGFGHSNGHFGTTPDQLESLMLMWRSVCSVCSKVCANPSELESHLKQHLNVSKERSDKLSDSLAHRVG